MLHLQTAGFPRPAKRVQRSMSNSIGRRSGRSALPLRAAIEALELRQMLAADFASLTSKGTLIVTGTGKPNTISVDYVGAKVVATLDRQTKMFPKSLVKRFNLSGVGGDDRIIVKIAKPATLIGGSGDDTLAGNDANDSLEGDGGNDSLYSAAGDDLLIGNSGDDRFDGGSGINRIHEGDGHDAFDYGREDASSFFVSDLSLIPAGAPQGAVLFVNRNVGQSIDAADGKIDTFYGTDQMTA